MVILVVKQSNIVICCFLYLTMLNPFSFNCRKLPLSASALSQSYHSIVIVIYVHYINVNLSVIYDNYSALLLASDDDFFTDTVTILQFSITIGF